MSRTIVKKKNVFSSDIADLFSIMAGVKDPDPAVIVPKYESLMDAVDEYNTIIKMLYAKILKRENNSILVLVNKSLEQYNTLYDTFIKTHKVEENSGVVPEADLADLNTDLEAKIQRYAAQVKCKYDVKQLLSAWKSVKDANIFLQNIVITTSNIKKLIEAEKERIGKKEHDFNSPNYITFAVNSEAFILKWGEAINFKIIYDSLSSYKDGEIAKKLLLKILKVVYEKGLAIHGLISKPDIDAQEFSTSMVSSICEMEKGIPGCSDAFKEIKNSVTLMENNFDRYYYDYYTSKNPMAMIETYLTDVMQRKSNNPSLTVQIKKIIATVRNKIQSQGIKDKKSEALFNAFTQVSGDLDTKKEEGSSSTNSSN